MELDASDWEKIGKKLFQFAHETITELAKRENKLADESLRLFLQAAQSASFCEFETHSYLITNLYQVNLVWLRADTNF